MRRRPLTPFGSHSIEKGIIHFRRGNADNPIRPTQSPADFQQRDGRGIASALEITQGRHGHATPFRRRLKRQIRRQTRRTNARTQRLQKFLPRLIYHNCSYKDRKRAYYTTTVFTKAIDGSSTPSRPVPKSKSSCSFRFSLLIRNGTSRAASACGSRPKCPSGWANAPRCRCNASSRGAEDA